MNNIEKLEGALSDDTACLIIELVQGEGGVHAVGASWTLPFSGTHCCWSSELIPAAPSTDTLPANMHAVTRGYLRALNATLQRGRDFNAGDYAVIHSRNDAPFTAPAIIDRPGAERGDRGRKRRRF